MSSNENASVEEYEGKQKDLEKMFNPIATKLYQGAPGSEQTASGANTGANTGQQTGAHMPGVD